MAVGTNYSAVVLMEDEYHGEAYQDTDGKLFVSLPERVPFTESPELTPHVCTGNETLVDVVLAYFRDLYENPVDKVWVVMNAQPEPIQDPTVPLPAGRIIMVPSPMYMDEFAYCDSLSDYPEM